MTDLLFNSPRLRFSRAQQQAILLWAKELGANVPSYDRLRNCQAALKEATGDPTTRQESGRGNVWYLNEIGDAIAKVGHDIYTFGLEVLLTVFVGHFKSCHTGGHDILPGRPQRATRGSVARH